MSAAGAARYLHGIVLAALLPAWAGAVSVEIENGVYKLDAKTFDKAINNRKYPAMMVEFYAPWCGHCKELMPKYEKAAKKLKKQTDGPRLAKVDATEETDIAEKYDVKGYPTLFVFKDGELYGTYHGSHEKTAIVDYMNSFLYPTPVGVLLRAFLPLKSALATVGTELRKLAISYGVPSRALPKTDYLWVILLCMPLLLSLKIVCAGYRAKPSPPKAAAKAEPAAAAAASSSAGTDSKPAEAEAKAKAALRRNASPAPKKKAETKKDS